MNWLIPSIILFGCMGLGLAMIPDIIKDSIPVVKEALEEYFTEGEEDGKIWSNYGFNKREA